MTRFQASEHTVARGGSGAFGRYSQLSDVTQVLTHAAKLGLCYMQTFEPTAERQTLLVTTVTFAPTGQSVCSRILLPDPQVNGRNNLAQATGSMLTYFRRYALMSIFGLAPDDDDGATASSRPAQSSSANDDFI